MEKIKLEKHIKYGATYYTPFTDPNGFGSRLSLTDWAKCLLPEYIWIGLIIKGLGRKEGLERFYYITKELERHVIATPQLSMICKFDIEKQQLFWNIVTKYIDRKMLQPLSVIITTDISPVFFNYFFDFSIDIETSINRLMEIIKATRNFHDELSTDICYVVDWFYIIGKKVCINRDMEVFMKAITEYPQIGHEDAIMKMYRPTIRSTFQVLGSRNADETFSSMVWRSLGAISPCEPYALSYERSEKMDYYNIVKKAMEYISATNEDKKMESKFTVVMGLTIYIYKLYNEIVDQNLQNSIGGKIIFRSMMDSYINLKYLLVKEIEIPDIYDKYKAYGYGKYKLVMAKLREGKYSIPSEAMINQKLIEYYVNEDMDEAFMNIDLGFFDRTSIRDKFIECDESELYEIYYEYTTNYAHGFWGAIRESSELTCGNPAHKHHLVPDYYDVQKTRSILRDCEMVMQKTLNCISPYIDLPDFYTQLCNVEE